MTSDFLPKRWLGFAIVIYLATLIFNIIWFKEFNQETVRCFSYIFIPWVSAILVKQNVISIKHLAIIGSFLWLYYILLGFCSVRLNEEIVGLSGNRNWTASLLLALIPWPVYAMKSLIPNHLKIMARLNNKYVFMIYVLILILLPTFFLVYKCSSRGAWLALILFGLIYLSDVIISALTFRTPYQRNYYNFGLGLSAFIGCFLVMFLFFTMISSNTIYKKFEHSVRSDVRLPLWISSVRMIKDNDLFLSSAYRIIRGTIKQDPPPKNKFGVGPGNFARFFSEYRSHSTYHSRLVAAPVTIHPHNQLLYLTSELGILAGIALCFMVIPIFQLRCAHDLIVKLCRFTAFILIIHSLFDLNLVKPPGNFIALFCLGVCWQTYFKSNSNVPIKHRKGNYLKYGFTLVVLLVMMIISLTTAIHDIKIDWYLRKGYLQEAKKEFKDAFATYSHVVKIAPDKIRPYLYGATVAVDRLHQPELAMPLLNKAYHLDTNFAHINQMIGKALSMTGAYNKALPFYIRECKLYPRSIKAYQSYFNSLAFNRDFARLPIIEDYLRTLYIEKADLSFDKVTFHRLINNWLDAMTENHTENAITIAEAICSNQNKQAVDPIFFMYHQRSDGKTFKAKKNFTLLDYTYWHDIYNIKAVANSIIDTPSAEPTQNNPNWDLFTLDRIKLQLDKRIEIDSRQEQFSFPFESWSRKRCSVLSYHCLFITLANHFGFKGLVFFDDDFKLKSIALKNDFCYTIGVKEGNVIKTPIQMFSEKLKKLKQADPVRFKQFIYPQQLWLKNQILGSLITHKNSLEFPKFDRIPIASLLEAIPSILLDVSEMQFIDLKKFVLSEPFDRIAYE